jgi:hypothetical protein
MDTTPGKEPGNCPEINHVRRAPKVAAQRAKRNIKAKHRSHGLTSRVGGNFENNFKRETGFEWVN